MLKAEIVLIPAAAEPLLVPFRLNRKVQRDHKIHTLASSSQLVLREDK